MRILQVRGMMTIGAALAAVALRPITASAQDAERDWSRSGAGWSMIRMDIDVALMPTQRRLELKGALTLRLDGLDESFGPNLKLNWTRDSVMSFAAVDAGEARVDLNVPQANAAFIKQAVIRSDKPHHRGDELTVQFSCASAGRTEQLLVDESMAMAAWVTGWLPYTNPTAEPLSLGAQAASVPGRTTLHLPPSWVGLVDGELIARQRGEDGVVETWNTPAGIARSMIAGPYDTAEEKINGRVIRVYLLPDEKPMNAKQLASVIAAALGAQEAKLGPFPFPSYGVVEAPLAIPGQTWGAASLQTFLVARSPQFAHEHGNLPLWAHEVGHGWWGNTVGGTGPGFQWCSESLAQLGALVAIETLEGEDALHEFLGFSRSGDSPFQCAAGYFAIIDQGGDLPVATMDASRWGHDLADSKGVWIYHMLRSRLGDKIFFGALREIIHDYAHRKISADEIRRRFIAAAPDADLDVFFHQWLDRTGAPVLDFDWNASSTHDGVVLRLTQTQAGEPFALDLDVAIELANGATVVRTVAVDAKKHTFELKTPGRPVSVRLDPSYKLLFWRPEYGPPPGADRDSTAPAIPQSVAQAVVGRYHVESVDLYMDVSFRDGAMFIRTTGGPELRMRYQGGSVFQIAIGAESAIVEFDLSRIPSLTATLRQGKQVFVGVRTDGD